MRQKNNKKCSLPNFMFGKIMNLTQVMTLLMYLQVIFPVFTLYH